MPGSPVFSAILLGHITGVFQVDRHALLEPEGRVGNKTLEILDKGVVHQGAFEARTGS